MEGVGGEGEVNSIPFAGDKMLPLGDQRWKKLKGGYKVPYDPSNTLHRLERGEDVWDELWQELHHQGDVGIASYAAIPHIVRIARSQKKRNWNFYSLISTIEIARYRKTNPPIPKWMKTSYLESIQEMLDIALNDIRHENDTLTIRSILGAIALARGDFKLGAFISQTDDSQIDEDLEKYYAWSELYTETA